VTTFVATAPVKVDLADSLPFPGAAPAGMTTLIENAPVESACGVPSVVCVPARSLKTSLIVSLAGKPAPVTVTDVPAGGALGVTEIEPSPPTSVRPVAE
jgi:hypothetical protein